MQSQWFCEWIMWIIGGHYFIVRSVDGRQHSRLLSWQSRITWSACSNNRLWQDTDTRSLRRCLQERRVQLCWCTGRYIIFLYCCQANDLVYCSTDDNGIVDLCITGQVVVFWEVNWWRSVTLFKWNWIEKSIGLRKA